jgi:hypothetical protein
MKYDNDTVLLVAICQKANPLDPQSSVAEYLNYFGSDVYRMGRVLRFLGLAKESNESDLGWVPNHRLMRIIAEKATRPFQAGGKIVVSKEDREFVASMYHLATGDVIEEDDNTDAIDFCCNVLAIFDLLEKGEGEDGGFKPTPRIKDLVSEHFLKVTVEEDEERDEDDEDDEGEEDDDEEDDEAHSGYRQTGGRQTPSPFCVPSMNGSLEAKVLYPARWWPRDSGTEGLRGASGAHREVGPESDG